MTAKWLTLVATLLAAGVVLWLTMGHRSSVSGTDPLPVGKATTNSGWHAASSSQKKVKRRDQPYDTSALSADALRLGQATQEVDLTYEVAAKFTAQDLAYLNECYRTRTNLVDRAELTRVLGMIGNEETVQLFIKCLTEEQAGKRFMEQAEDPNREPELVLWTTLTSLGLLASSHDSAFAFLKGTVRPEYWNATINWQSHHGHRSVGLMTNWAIQAIANSGRPEAREVLAELVQNSPTPWPPGFPKNHQRTFDGAIISAAYMLDRIEMVGGMDNFKAGHGPPMMTGFSEWRSSEKAKPWLQAK
jgi:hypothetical protein